MFFDREYVFKGRHAQYVIELKNAIFNRNLDVLILAPIIGLVYDRRSDVYTSEEYANVTTKIFAEQMTSENEKILFNYRLCMLLTEQFNESDKVDNAFRYYIDDNEHHDIFEKNIKMYNSYILGGVEVLYELMLKGNKEYNGDANKESYKRAVLNDVTEFISDYMNEVADMNSLNDDLNF